MLLTHRSGSRLAPYVEVLWYYDGACPTHHKERVLPNGRFQIALDLTTGRGTVSGMRSQYVVIDPPAILSVMGVVFRHGGARGFFDAPACEFYNQAVPLDGVWGPQVTELADRLREGMTAGEKFRVLENALVGLEQQRGEPRSALHPAVRYGLREFRHLSHVQTVIRVSKDARLSRRRFSQLFREQIGMTPKSYCRLIRFRHIVRQVAAGFQFDWADVALAGGYYDQSHLDHEFRAFSGMSPSAFLAAERPFLNHVRID
jgi:AraC-like DNA-binding protein